MIPFYELTLNLLNFLKNTMYLGKNNNLGKTEAFINFRLKFDQFTRKVCVLMGKNKFDSLENTTVLCSW